MNDEDDDAIAASHYNSQKITDNNNDKSNETRQSWKKIKFNLFSI